MATTLKTKIGHMRCLCCGERIPVKQAENGTLNVSCPECDLTAYVKRGTDAHARVMAALTKAVQPAPAPEPKAAPVKAAPTPIAQSPVSKKSTIFG